ncbi:MAG: adenylyl-sulfate kinase [Desulfomonile tiedjei]|nr:adenylyl-sulfate kinase [Desulfomonile tiedjei]
MKQQHAGTIWFTGLSGSGKSTLSSKLKEVLEARGKSVVLLDGDSLRAGLNRDLGFSPLERAENIRRAGEVAKILTDTGITVVAAFITPLDSLRRAVRGLFESDRFVEIFLDCPIEVCEQRDFKGLYARARSGEVPAFTGISAPFERPGSSELEVPTGVQTIEESLDMIVSFLDTGFASISDAGALRHAVASGAKRRVAVIGLDGVPPSLVFGSAGEDLVNLRALMDHGLWGPLRSTDPPITVPAWASITTGRDPGELGMYGFRNRLGYDYREMTTFNASHVQAPRCWDYVEEAGGSSIVVALPQTYPPRPHQGITVAGFPFPDGSPGWVYPESVRDEIPLLAEGDYIPDVTGFRNRERGQLLQDIYTMIERRFRLARDLVIHRPWDFFMMVEIAPDRLHHAFWRYANPDHRLYEPGNRFEHAIRDAYRYLDSCIGSLLALLDDDTTVLVVSDHGAKTMAGGICINEWLIRNGLLVLHAQPDEETPLKSDMVDWSRTRVWSEGGYYARIFLNVKGREPQGTIEPYEYESFRNDLAEKLRQIPDERGVPMANKVLKPEEIYRTCNHVAPDLILYFDNLSRRSIGTIGHGDLYRAGNDTGPDDANHDPDGIFIAARLSDLRQGRRKGTQVSDASCLDITPTILHEFGLRPPEDLTGKIIDLDGHLCGSTAEGASPHLPAAAPASAHPEPASGFTAEEEEIVKKRLMDLGYL